MKEQEDSSVMLSDYDVLLLLGMFKCNSFPARLD